MSRGRTADAEARSPMCRQLNAELKKRGGRSANAEARSPREEKGGFSCLERRSKPVESIERWLAQIQSNDENVI